MCRPTSDMYICTCKGCFWVPYFWISTNSQSIFDSQSIVQLFPLFKWPICTTAISVSNIRRLTCNRYLCQKTLSVSNYVYQQGAICIKHTQYSTNCVKIGLISFCDKLAHKLANNARNMNNRETGNFSKTWAIRSKRWKVQKRDRFGEKFAKKNHEKLSKFPKMLNLASKLSHIVNKLNFQKMFNLVRKM